MRTVRLGLRFPASRSRDLPLPPAYMRAFALRPCAAHPLHCRSRARERGPHWMPARPPASDDSANFVPPGAQGLGLCLTLLENEDPRGSRGLSGVRRSGDPLGASGKEGKEQGRIGPRPRPSALHRAELEVTYARWVLSRYGRSWQLCKSGNSDVLITPCPRPARTANSSPSHSITRVPPSLLSPPGPLLAALHLPLTRTRLRLPPAQPLDHTAAGPTRRFLLAFVVTLFFSSSLPTLHLRFLSSCFILPDPATRPFPHSAFVIRTRIRIRIRSTPAHESHHPHRHTRAPENFVRRCSCADHLHRSRTGTGCRLQLHPCPGLRAHRAPSLNAHKSLLGLGIAGPGSD